MKKTDDSLHHTQLEYDGKNNQSEGPYNYNSVENGQNIEGHNVEGNSDEIQNDQPAGSSSQLKSDPSAQNTSSRTEESQLHDWNIKIECLYRNVIEFNKLKYFFIL